MKNSNDTIRNRTRDLPAYSAVPQPAVLPRSPEGMCGMPKFVKSENSLLAFLNVVFPTFLQFHTLSW